MTTGQRKMDGVAIASLILGMIPIASLVLGIISPIFGCLLVFCIISSIPAVICGHIAKSRIKKNPDTLRGGSIASAGLVMGYAMLAFFVLGLLILPGHIDSRENARRVCCLMQQNSIYKAAAAWSTNHNNSYPPDLQTLVNEGRLDPGTDIFRCVFMCLPSLSPGRYIGPTSQVDQWSDYIIVSNRNFGDGQAVLIYEKPDCHKGKGGNATMANGTGRWYDAEEYRRLIDGLKR